MAQDDSDQWVAIVANILKSYPGAGTLNTELEDHHSFFHEVLGELKKYSKNIFIFCFILSRLMTQFSPFSVKKSTPADMPPLECLYLGKSAANHVAGSTPAPSRHFALKRRPKSAALRVELLQKCKRLEKCIINAELLPHERFF